MQPIATIVAWIFLQSTTVDSRRSNDRLAKQVRYLEQRVVSEHIEFHNHIEWLNDTLFGCCTGATQAASCNEGRSDHERPTKVEERRDNAGLVIDQIKRGFHKEKQVVRERFDTMHKQSRDYIGQMEGRFNNLTTSFQQHMTKFNVKTDGMNKRLIDQFEAKQRELDDEFRSFKTNLSSVLQAMKSHNENQYAEVLSSVMDVKDMVTSVTERHLGLSALLSDFRESVLARLNSVEHSAILGPKLSSKLHCGEEGWVYNNANSCYKAVSSYENSQDAENTCTQMNSYLVELGSEEETNFVRTNVMRENGRYLIGLEYTTSTDWIWRRSEVKAKFSNWMRGEPNNMNTEHCSEMLFPLGKWNNVPCTAAKYFVCEKQAVEW